MNERPNADELRDALRARADDVGDTTAMRERVRQHLDAATGDHRRDRSGILRAAAVVAALAVGALGLFVVTGRDTSDTGAAQGRPVQLDDFAADWTLTVPNDVSRSVVLLESSSDVAVISLAGPDTADPPRVPTLRLVRIPPELSAEQLFAGLRDGLFDTDVIGVGESSIGGESSTVAQLASDKGSTLVSFAFGDEIYVTAAGVDRRHEIHVADDSDVAVWIDAPSDGFDAVRSDVDAILTSSGPV